MINDLVKYLLEVLFIVIYMQSLKYVLKHQRKKLIDVKWLNWHDTPIVF